MNQIASEIPAGMARSLIDVAEALGVNVALKLMHNYGGLEVKFPSKPADDHPVVKALGKEDAKALCFYLSGFQLYVPHGRTRKSARRDVISLQEAGKSRKEIARLLGISQRHVRRMANLEQPENQMDLFGE